jgi:hypothetical protein
MTDWGCFTLEQDPERPQIITLCLKKQTDEKLKLQSYCSISDALSAVSQQRTGYADWDQLPLEKIPHRIHDITSWYFLKK